MSMPRPIHGRARPGLDATLRVDACGSDASDSSWANVSAGKPVEPDSGRTPMADALTSGEARKLTRAEAQWLDQARKRLLHASRRSTRPVERRRDR